jgi:hypothetical protein
MLKDRYDLDLMVEPICRDHILQVYEHYSEQRLMLRAEPLMENTEQYSKAYLISEAARMILREIAPKRTKKKKGES